nr:MFS transporter [Nocardiopsis algeriensis]
MWAAGTLTNLADGMLFVALPLIATTLTHDPLAVAGLTVVRFLPWLLISPFAGVLVDRVDRLRALLWSNGIASAAVALLALSIVSGGASLWLLYAVLFTVICCETVTDPAHRISVADLVPARLLDRANSRTEGARLVAQDCVAAPVTGVLFTVAALLPVAGAALSYALCAVLVAVVAVLARRTRRAVTVPARKEESAESLGASLRAGFAYVLGNRLARNLAVNNAAIMVGAHMGTSVAVLHAGQVLGVPDALYGLYMSSIALGGIAGAALSTLLVTRLGRRTVLIGGDLGLGLAIALVGLSSSPWTAAAGLTLLGVCMTATNIAAAPFLQHVVPEHLRGRASAVFRLVGWGLTPLGALAGGLLGRIDLALPYVAGGLVMLLGTLCFLRSLAEVSRLCDGATANVSP